MINRIDRISADRVIELTKTLVEIPSETGKEQELAEWMIDFYTGLGLSGITKLPVKDAGDTVFATLKGEGGPKMMLVGLSLRFLENSSKFAAVLSSF